MKALAATLTCLCLHTAAFAQCNGAALAQPSCAGDGAALTSITAAAIQPPAPVRTVAGRGDEVLMAELAPGPAVHADAAPAADKAGHTDSRTLLMVGLALMAGIALRRWGNGHP